MRLIKNWLWTRTIKEADIWDRAQYFESLTGSILTLPEIYLLDRVGAAWRYKGPGWVPSELPWPRRRMSKAEGESFPHFDAEGLSGYELKNTGFTGFACGGTKALWMSHARLDDTRLVILESAIDALSHAVLFPDEHARYASIGGKPNPQQSGLIRAAAKRMPRDSEIVAAMDADEDGGKLAVLVRKAVELTGRQDLRFSVHEPFGHKDFNDQLRAIPKRPLLSRTEEPSVA